MSKDLLFQELKNTHNFILGPVDTDSISFCKLDQSEITTEEQKKLINEINSLFPELINYSDDGYFETVIILKSKNYVLKKKGEKPKYKGSAIVATLKEPALKQFIKDIIKEMGIDRNDFVTVYNKYVKEIMDIKDITPWCTKKTVTEAVQKNERANESKVRDAMGEDSDYRMGDKLYVFFKNDNTVCLKENFDGDYSKDKLLGKLYKTAEIFETVIDTDQFLNYALKRNKKKLEEILK